LIDVYGKDRDGNTLVKWYHPVSDEEVVAGVSGNDKVKHIRVTLDIESMLEELARTHGKTLPNDYFKFERGKNYNKRVDLRHDGS